MKTIRIVKWRIRRPWLRLTNWLGGYAYCSVKRCRHCDHTVYPSDRIGKACRYCSEPSPADQRTPTYADEQLAEIERRENKDAN